MDEERHNQAAGAWIANDFLSNFEKFTVSLFQSIIPNCFRESVLLMDVCAHSPIASVCFEGVSQSSRIICNMSH